MPSRKFKRRRREVLGRGLLLLGLCLRVASVRAQAAGEAPPKKKKTAAASPKARGKPDKPASAPAAPSVPPLAPGVADFIPSREVSFQQVLDDPDNVELNYRYVAAEVRRGNLKTALAAAERLLLSNPDQIRLRMVYAVLLYRLDNLEEAKRELDTVLHSQPAHEIAEEARLYMKLAQQQLNRTQFSGRLSAGFQYDSNRNAAPESNQRLFTDVPLALTGNSLRRGDTALVTAAGLEARRRTGSQAGHELFAGVDYYRVDQNTVHELNLQAYSARAGALLRLPGWEVTPTGLFDHVLLDQSTYLRDRGGSLLVRRQVNRRAGVFFELREIYQDFVETPIFTVSTLRSGPEHVALIGADMMVTPVVRIDGSYTHLIKRASQEFNSYRREAVQTSIARLLGRGAFLKAALTAGYDYYESADYFVSATRRQDRNMDASLTFGVPLSAQRPFWRDLLWSVTYAHQRAWSNITNYSYYNHRVSSLVTYRWNAGF